MVAKARRRIAAADGANAHLLAADARALPFPSVFDVVYSAYTLDLMTLPDVSLALSEFRRVLKPDGRMVLVNMSKEHPWNLGWFERIYKAIPASWARTFSAAAARSFWMGSSGKLDSATSSVSSSGTLFLPKSYWPENRARN
jgi:ubiquinone/menaquinone biosynthesis C-methylase UbiE